MYVAIEQIPLHQQNYYFRNPEKRFIAYSICHGWLISLYENNNTVMFQNIPGSENGFDTESAACIQCAGWHCA